MIKKNKKAILFTLDSIFALLLAMSFLVYINTYLVGTSDLLYTNLDLLQISKDGLGVLEKSGTLLNTVQSLDSTQLQNYVDSLPIHICGNITLYDSLNVQFLSVLKSSCLVSEENALSRRVFISNFTPYLATMEIWYLEQ